MLHFMKKHTGVSLVEVMLVLFISSLIAIAAFQYQKTQNENAVAAEFAERMYEYSQAVRTFTDEHETELASGMAAPFTSADAPGSAFTQNGSDYIITGVDWLTVVNSPVTGTPYLPKAFTFEDLQPLQLQMLPGAGGTGTPLIGNAAIKVDISGAAASRAQITIEYGALYDVADPNKPAAPKASVTAKAAKIASSLNDPLMGPSSFDYVGGGIDANGAVFPIVATIKHSTVKGESYLRLDGTNSMLDNISFDVANAARRDITGIQNIKFEGTDGIIGNVNTISFPASGTTSKIENINAINFASGGVIQKVKQISFENGNVFSGIGAPIEWFQCANQELQDALDKTGNPFNINACNKSDSRTVVTNYNAANYICTMNGSRFNDGSSGNNKSCTLEIDAVWYKGRYKVIFENALGCGMICFQYHQ